MSTPFIFFEFDSSLFQKYYGSGINTPGIYAIPEDEVEPSSGQINSNPAAEKEANKTGLDQRDESRENLLKTVQNLPEIPFPQLSQDEQQAFEQEIQPLKKVYLINKLNQLKDVLQDNSLTNDDLLLVLKYGPYLTYNTLKLLTIQIVNDLKRSLPNEYLKTEENGGPIQQNIQPSNVSNNNINGNLIGAAV